MLVKKLEVHIPKARLDEIDELLNLTGMESRQEIVGCALTVLFWCFTQVRQGRDICAVDPELGLQRELSMPLLEAIKGMR